MRQSHRATMIESGRQFSLNYFDFISVFVWNFCF